MLSRILHRWADATLQKQVEALEVKLQEQESLLRLRDLEIEGLASIVTRDRKRVEAETAIAARQIAGE